MPGPAFGIQMVLLFNGVYTANSGGSTTGIDISASIGDIFLLISDRTGGTAAATLTIEMSESLSTGYVTVPASAIFTVPDGVATAFGALSTAVFTQVRGINRQQLSRYLRVTTAGTTITHNLAIVAAYSVAQTSDIT